MVTNKRKWECIWLITILAFLGASSFNVENVSNRQIVITIFVVLLFLWDMLFNYRRFHMTRSHLSEGAASDSLEYMYYTSLDPCIINKIWVRNPYIDSTWYELDYKLCIPKNCNEVAFNDFTIANKKSHDLLWTMNQNANRTASIDSYQTFKKRYNISRYVSLAIIIISFLIGIAKCKNKETYDYGYVNSHSSYYYDYDY